MRAQLGLLFVCQALAPCLAALAAQGGSGGAQDAPLPPPPSPLPSPSPGGAAPQADERLGKLLANARTALDERAFGRAITLLQEVHRLQPGDGDVARVLAVTHTRLGAAQYDRGDLHLAERSYRAADRLLPGQADILRSLGIVLMALDQPREARAALLRAVAQDPQQTEAWRLLAQLAEREDDHEAAAAYMQRASESAPQRPELARLADELERRRQVERAFTTIEQGRLRVQHAATNAAAARIVPQVCGWLEQALAELEQELGPMPAGTVTVVLYTRDEFTQINMHAWAQAFYDGKIRQPLMAPALLRTTLRHEAAHAYLRAAHPGAPGWVHEGWAQWFQGRSTSVARTSLAGVALREEPPAVFWQRDFLAASDTTAVQAGYDQALLSVAWLMRAHGRDDLVRLLAQLDAGGTSDEALLAVYGYGFDELVRRSR